MDRWKQRLGMASLDTPSKRDWKIWEIAVLILLMQAAGLLTFFLLRWGFGP